MENSLQADFPLSEWIGRLAAAARFLERYCDVVLVTDLLGDGLEVLVAKYGWRARKVEIHERDTP